MKTRCRNFFVVFVVGLLAFTDDNLHAQQYKVLHTFTGWPSDGVNPVGRLLLISNTLYGTTFGGGTNIPDAEAGIIFSVKTDGSGYTVLHSFSTYLEGSGPNGGLKLSGNTLYGVTESGGQPNDWGTLFSINTDGSGFNIVHNFALADGRVYIGNGNYKYDNQPWSDLLMSGDTLYGMTVNGLVYSANTNGAFLLLGVSFGGSDGVGGNDFGLVLTNDILYGVTENGGSNGLGTVYATFTDGTESQILHVFGNGGRFSTEGTEPSGRLAISGNTLYGTTQIGGLYGFGTIFSIQIDTLFYTNLYHFTGGNDGADSGQGLILSGDTLYGVASGGGYFNANGAGPGTIFSIKTDGTGFTVLHTFGGADGNNPSGGLILSGCTLFGTCSGAGGQSTGTVFSFAIVPNISSWNLTSTNVVLNMTNGVANCAYMLLTTTNLNLPASQWTSLATNVPTLAGNFTFTVTNGFNPADSQRYYTVRSQ